MTIDYRLHDLLTGAYYRAGDEPQTKQQILVTYKGKKVYLPLPEGAEITVESK